MCGNYCFVCLVGGGAYLLSLTLTNVTNKPAISILKSMNNNKTPRRQCCASSWSSGLDRARFMVSVPGPSWLIGFLWPRSPFSYVGRWHFSILPNFSPALWSFLAPDWQHGFLCYCPWSSWGFHFAHCSWEQDGPMAK